MPRRTNDFLVTENRLTVFTFEPLPPKPPGLPWGTVIAGVVVVLLAALLDGCAEAPASSDSMARPAYYAPLYLPAEGPPYRPPQTYAAPVYQPLPAQHYAAPRPAPAPVPEPIPAPPVRVAAPAPEAPPRRPTLPPLGMVPADPCVGWYRICHAWAG